LATWNINHMNLESEKYTAKKNTIGRLFKKNDWLDALVLQEINQVSLQTLQDDVNDENLQLELGPHLISIGEGGGYGQHEYYPIVFRRDRLAFDGCWALHRGVWTRCDRKTTIFWSKTNPNYRKYRPIVVYRMLTNSYQYVHFAV